MSTQLIRSLVSGCSSGIRHTAAYLKNPLGRQRIVGNVQKLRNYSSEATIDVGEDSFKLHNFETGPSTSASLNKEQALLYAYQMQLIRRLENASAALYREKVIRGFCHLYTGQEACAVGMKAAMRPPDSVITAYRCHAWTVLMGVTSAAMMAELTGRISGCSRGKGGSMHMYGKNFYGGNGIVGAQVPLGAGIGLASQYKGDGGICFALYGDGASNQGQCFEAYNMACLWKLPCIFVCENNQYGMGTRQDRHACETNFYKRGHYVPGIWVDGMNVLAVRNATEFAIDYCLKNGPVVIEVNTYRYVGHSMSDPGISYRSREEVQDVRQKRDPIANFKNLCLSNNILTEEDYKKIDEDSKKEVDDAVEISKKDPEVEIKELVGDIYLKNYEPKIRNLTGFNLDHIQINKGSSP